MAARKVAKTAQKRRSAQKYRVAKKSRVAKPKTRMTSKTRSSTGPKKRTAKQLTASRKVPRTARQRESQKQQQQRAEVQRRLDELFEQQIDSLWGSLGHQCRDFAEGYNLEIGAQHLDVQQHPNGVLVKFSESGGEVGLQLDREHRSVTCYLHSGWTNLGSSIVESPPVSLTIQDGQLRLVYSGAIVSEEDLAVRLLTDLTGAHSPTAS